MWFDKERDVVHFHWTASIERCRGRHPAPGLLVRVESKVVLENPAIDQFN